MIGRDGLIMIALGGPGPETALLAPADLLFAHEPADPISSMPLAALTQGHLDARRSISPAAVLVDLGDLLFELLILAPALAELVLSLSPVVKTAGGDLKSLARRLDRMLSLHGRDGL